MGKKSKLSTLGSGLAQGGTLGFADEVTNSLGAILAKGLRPDLFEDQSLGEVYREGMDASQANIAQHKKDNPKTQTLGEVLGAVLNPVTMAAGGAVAKGGAGIGRAMGMGAAEGAAYGFGTGYGTEDRLKGAVTDGVIGAVSAGGAKLLMDDIAKSGGLKKWLGDETGAVGLDDYKMAHTAPLREDGVANTLDNAVDMFGDDIYDPNVAWRYFGGGDTSMDKESARIIAGFKGKPDAEVEIFRAVPKGVKKINEGDWVTINKKYAQDHGTRHIDGDFDVISQKVKANDIATDANSLHEWGYSPKPTPKNDYFAGTKVVDDAGEPLTVYHGTAGKIDWSDRVNPKVKGIEEFKRMKGERGLGFMGATREVDSPSFFFTPDKRTAASFAESKVNNGSNLASNIEEVRLNIKNPFDITKKTPAVKKALLEAGYSKEAIDAETTTTLWNFLDDDKFVNYLKAQGYDGAITNEKTAARIAGAENAKDVISYAAFEPNQIKSIHNKNPTSDPRIMYGLAAMLGLNGMEQEKERRPMEEMLGGI